MTHFTDNEKLYDPEFADRFDYFAFADVPKLGKLTSKMRYLAILATLLGCQGIDEFNSVSARILQPL